MGMDSRTVCAAALPLPRTDKSTESWMETFPIPFHKQVTRLSDQQVEPFYFFSLTASQNSEKGCPYLSAGGTALLALLISDPTVTVPRSCIGPFQKRGEKAVP